MVDQELLAAIGQIMDTKLDPINKRLDRIEEDLDILKEDSAATRNATNILLRWAEKVDITMNVGLYEKE